jgi:hypothetical protein
MIYFQTKNHDLGKFLEVLAMEDAGMYIVLTFGQFHGHLVHFMVLWYILWSFGIFSPFWCIVPRKIWQPWFGRETLLQKSETVSFIAG